jgi:hypothetical protein
LFQFSIGDKSVDQYFHHILIFSDIFSMALLWFSSSLSVKGFCYKDDIPKEEGCALFLFWGRVGDGFIFPTSTTPPVRRCFGR